MYLLTFTNINGTKALSYARLIFKRRLNHCAGAVTLIPTARAVYIDSVNQLYLVFSVNQLPICEIFTATSFSGNRNVAIEYYVFL